MNVQQYFYILNVFRNRKNKRVNYQELSLHKKYKLHAFF